MRQKVAYVISSVLRPELLTVVLILFGLTHVGLSAIQIYRLGLLYLIVEFIAPLTFLLAYLRLHPGVTWELTNRRDRYAYLSFVTICSLACLLLTAKFGNHLIFSLGLIIFILLIINVAITFFWKISLHMAGITVPILLVNYLSHWQYLFLFLLIPIVGWARYVLKRHTLAQIITGFILNAVIGSALLQLL